MVSAIVAAAVLAVGQQVDPYDFEVDVDYKPDLSVSPQPSCSPDGAGGLICDTEFPYVETGRSLTGSGRRISTGQAGTFRTTCDWSFSVHATFHVAGLTDLTFRQLHAGGPQTCSWAIQLAGGTLSGDMRGNATISLAGPRTAQYSLAMTATVVGGTGDFAGLVGGGTYTHSETVPLALSGARVLAEAAKGSPLQLRLRKGKPVARLWAGRGELRVVTVPGSTCRIRARKGARVVRATVRDGNRDGLLTRRLAPGRWTIVAACTKATARAVVTVG